MTPCRALVLLIALLPWSAFAATKVTLLHFSDYHSHAVPFFSEGRARQGGIAPAIGYMKKMKARGALVFSGGDMINKGAPAWSDHFGCAEWPWLNGLVDAMAFGNHDADYGRDAFEKCVQSIRYPLLSANTSGFRGWQVFTANGMRIGVFAIAGEDFRTLVQTPGFTFSDPIAAARDAVRALREDEKVDAVVMIGHQGKEHDLQMAREVPGIDVIFGSHSHLKEPLTRIEGTSTWFVSPSQYLTYISRVELAFDGAKKLTGVSGELVRVDERLSNDRAIARRVRTMQKELETAPDTRALFEVIAVAATPLEVDGLLTQDAPFPTLVMQIMKRVVEADVAISTASSFRQSIDSGVIRFEDLRNAMPYDNEIVVYELTGQRLRRLIEHSASQSGTDFHGTLAGIRALVDKSGAVTLLEVGGTPIDERKTYRVATTDYLARVAPGYREIFVGLEGKKSGLKIRDEVRKHLAANSPVSISEP